MLRSTRATRNPASLERTSFAGGAASSCGDGHLLDTVARSCDPAGMDKWPGTKNAAGVTERLISMIPEHTTYISSFAGHCAVGCRMRPAERRVFVDRDEAALAFWRQRDPAAECYRTDGIAWLRFFFGLDAFQQDPAERPDVFVFVDPPYFPGTCGKGIYRHELTAAEHGELLGTLKAIRAPVMLAGYRCPLYNRELRGWRRVDYPVMTRGGEKTESVWLNYPEPQRLHDPRFIGQNKRERERIRRRQRNLVAMVGRLDPRERQALLDAIAGSGSVT